MLKYLFEVEYKDGLTYSQNEQDISISNPLKSCFYDIKQNEVKIFSLKGNSHNYLVDLIDGHFEIDGVPFRFHNETLKDFRLIFWRQHTHMVNVSNSSLKELSHKIIYRFGWQTNNEKGENIQRIMEIN